MNAMTIEPLPTLAGPGTRTRRCHVIWQRDGMPPVQELLWYELPDTVALPEADDCDAYLLAMVMDAMLLGGTLTVQGSVSQVLLSNLVEFQGAWCKWLPALYRPIEVRVRTVRDDAGRQRKGAVAAYSGGVDATFSVWRNTRHRNGHRSQQLALCAMVHGFDIPLSEEAAFGNAFKTSARTLGDMDLPLVPVRTNYRLVAKASWEHAFSAALAAALDAFKQQVGTAVIGSSEPYDALVIPWGSSPITDHLLSSGALQVMHDGATHSRTEKVREISDWDVGATNLRVCWQGDLKDRNCGRCEKCLRTMLNFLACSKPVPACFPQDVDLPKALRHVVLRNPAVQAEWRQIVQYADRHQVAGKWRSAAAGVIARSYLLEALLPTSSGRRRLLVKVRNTLRPPRHAAALPTVSKVS